jgi:YegS/Rv2252/BmrU family lipid kinase
MFSAIEHLSTRPKPKEVRVVVNPAPSRKIPLLAILNQAFRDAGIHWDIDITHGDGDGHLLAKKAVEDGVDVVAVYGGDGTVMEVASALIGTDTPLLILGGGTGNLVASELRVPTILEKSCDLVCSDEFSVRTIDVGMLGDQPFLLRVGCGLETGVVQDATRELKDQFGKWAYVFAGIKALQEGNSAEYEIIVDGKTVSSNTGVACVIANAGTVGLGKLTLAPSVDIDDGMLDVFFLKKANIEGITRLAVKMMGLDQLKVDGEPLLDASHMLSHWQGGKIEVRTDPVQDIQADGDVVAQTPMIAQIKSACLKVVVE